QDPGGWCRYSAGGRKPPFPQPWRSRATASTATPTNSRNPMVEGNRTRRLRFFLRDFRMVEAHVALAEGQSLTSCLTHRKTYINLQDALWQSTGEKVDHAVL